MEERKFLFLFFFVFVFAYIHPLSLLPVCSGSSAPFANSRRQTPGGIPFVGLLDPADLIKGFRKRRKKAKGRINKDISYSGVAVKVERGERHRKDNLSYRCASTNRNRAVVYQGQQAVTLEECTYYKAKNRIAINDYVIFK